MFEGYIRCVLELRVDTPQSSVAGKAKLGGFCGEGLRAPVQIRCAVIPLDMFVDVFRFPQFSLSLSLQVVVDVRESNTIIYLERISNTPF